MNDEKFYRINHGGGIVVPRGEELEKIRRESLDKILEFCSWEQARAEARRMYREEILDRDYLEGQAFAYNQTRKFIIEEIVGDSIKEHEYLVSLLGYKAIEELINYYKTKIQELESRKDNFMRDELDGKFRKGREKDHE